MYKFFFMLKAGPARETNEFLRSCVRAIHQAHPTAKITKVESLGDRIMGRPVFCHGVEHLVGRVVQMSVYADPAVYHAVRGAVDTHVGSTQVFRYYMHKTKDLV
jgi:hypothetical protein